MPRLLSRECSNPVVRAPRLARSAATQEYCGDDNNSIYNYHYISCPQSDGSSHAVMGVSWAAAGPLVCRST